MFKRERNSLIRVTSQLRETFKNRLKVVIAFGSRVRGDFHGESDFDVLVIVEGLSVDDEIKIIKIFSEEEERTGIPYEVVIKSLAVFEKERLYKTGFYRNIINEGVILFDSIIRREKSRTDVDYGDFEEIDRKKAKESLKKAQEFLVEADRLINALSIEL